MVVYVSRSLEVALVTDAGAKLCAEDVVFDGMPMRRASVEWLAMLRAEHTGTHAAAVRLASILKEHPQDNTESHRVFWPSDIEEKWEDE